jgi:hypothetical protein
MESPLYRIEVFRDLAPDERSALHRFLIQQFDRVKTEHPANQAMTAKEFDSVLDSPSTFAILCHDSAGTIAGATVVTSDLSAVAWVSPAFFEQRYPSSADTPVFFITSLAVARSVPRQVLNALIDRLTDIVANAGGVAIADLADEDRDHTLARHIAGRVAVRYQSDWRAIGSQTYHAFRPGKRVHPISWSEAHRLLDGRPIGPGAVRD